MYLGAKNAKGKYTQRDLAEGTLVDPALEKKWMPVSMYIGGPEHACMHLIYARFVMKALKDFGFVSHSEPFKKLVHQGLITNQGAKMSKSKGNVVSPDAFVDEHGSDVFRMYLMFMGPFTDGGDWSDTGIKGIVRFVQRVWQVFESKAKKGVKDAPPVLAALHKTIKKVTADIEVLHFNTAIAALMELLNFLEKQEAFSFETAQSIALLLAPLAPHLSEELWSIVSSKKGFVIDQSWPTFDPALIKEDTMTIVVQINGKVRGDLVIASDANKDAIIKAAKELPNVQKYLTGPMKKEIYVPGRLVSLVV
jgi:leucyl-tRNA synthetase